MFTGLRATVMDYVLVPFADLVGVEKRKGKARFAEQAWVLIYDTSFWSVGMVSKEHDWVKKIDNSRLTVGASISCTIPNTGSICTSSGQAGPTEKWTGCSSGTTLFSSHFGCNRSWSSTLKSVGRTTGRCSRITSSPARSCSQVTGTTKPGLAT